MQSQIELTHGCRSSSSKSFNEDEMDLEGLKLDHAQTRQTPLTREARRPQQGKSSSLETPPPRTIRLPVCSDEEMSLVREHLTFPTDDSIQPDGSAGVTKEHCTGKSTLVKYSGSATALSCLINLVNTVAGTGMLGLPGAFASSGFIIGTTFLVFAALFSANGLRLLALSAEKVGISKHRQSSFYVIASAALPQYTILIDFAVALKCFGVATGYFITVGDCMVDSFHYFFQSGGLSASRELQALLTSRQFWVISGLLLVLPISFFKTLDALRFTSTVSLLLIYSLAVVVVLYAEGAFDPCRGMAAAWSDDNITVLQSNDQASEEDIYFRFLLESDFVCQGEVEEWGDPRDALSNIAVFVFSFTCHQNVFAVVNEIRDRTQARVNLVISAAIGLAFMLYMVVAVEGYRTYGNNVAGDILLSYPQTALVTIMRIAIAIMVVLSYPLQLDPSRRCITSMVYSINDLWIQKHAGGISRGDNAGVFGRESNTEENGHEKLSPVSLCDNDPAAAMEEIAADMEEIDLLQAAADHFLFNGITSIFLVSSFIVAMIVSDLGIVLAVVGATGSTMVSYILPGSIYIKLHPDQFTCVKVLAYLQLAIGVTIVPTALYFVLFQGASA